MFIYLNFSIEWGHLQKILFFLEYNLELFYIDFALLIEWTQKIYLKKKSIYSLFKNAQIKDSFKFKDILSTL